MLVRCSLMALCLWAIAGCRGPAEARGATQAPAAVPAAVLGARAAPLHRVADGETLYSIARTHGTSTTTLRALNPDVEPRRLRVGQAIRLPASDAEEGGKPLLRAIRTEPE